MKDKKKEMSHRLTAFYVLILMIGLATIILAVNEVTMDSYDRMGSNYWLSYLAIVSGVVAFGLALWQIRFRAKSS